jgi:ribose transport system substrate-binding protein
LEERFMLRLSALAMTLLCVIGCTKATGEKPGGAAAGGKKLEVAVIVKEATHDFWKSVHAGADQAASELGNVELQWRAPSRGDDRDEQSTIVENFITGKVDGICLAPIDSRALVRVVKLAKAEGIPTVIFDSGLDDENDIVSYVATDNRNGGRLAGKELGKRLGGKGKVILLRYNPGSESTEQREKGFLETIQQDFPEIEIIADDYGGVTENSALDKSQQLLLKFGKDVNGIFAVNESAATGMLRALEEAGLSGKVVYVGFDSSPRMVQALRDGKLQAMVLQDPVNMGYQSVKTMVAHLNGTPVEHRVSTGETVATQENMDDPHVHSLLFPKQFSE